MASKAPRHRSNTSVSTSSSRRPKSRASTTSVHSATTQPSYQYQPMSESTYKTQPQYHHHQAIQPTPEDMIRRSSQQLMNPGAEYAIDPSLHHQVNNGSTYGLEATFEAQDPRARLSLERYNSFDGRGSQVPEGMNDDAGQDDTGGDGKKKKGSASSIANDLELRRLFRENEGRLLKEVAAEVLSNERGPKAEKTKQIFAMLWLHKTCKRNSGSVPRGRVFSHYATRCGTERVPPLNPASFGKLVRIIFPGVQTRRLGMRGESKYHYVELSLEEDQQDILDAERAHTRIDMATFPQTEERHLSRSHTTQLPTDTVVLPSPRSSHAIHPASSHSRTTMAGLYLDQSAHNFVHGLSHPEIIEHELKFSTLQDPLYQEDEPIELPSIHPYVPVGIDRDVADALTALYRSHCVSVIDCFRFCKEKMFWHHFTSFHGTLTVPVQKLLSHPSIAAWITECDWLMYQQMIRFVAPLALQVVPVRVLNTFRAISTRLTSHVLMTFQNHPQHVRDAKLSPATIFAGLLDRLLRVNASAHAAANLLTNDENRDKMWYDWVLHVKPTKAVECTLPPSSRIFSRVVHILTHEMRDLVSPVNTYSYNDFGLVFESTNTASDPVSQQFNSTNNSTEGVLDRWTNFLQNLPQRFPDVDARSLLSYIGAVGSAVLRDITMAQCASFGTWWITKVWVDEMVLWLAEKGGFMEHSPSGRRMATKTEVNLTHSLSMDMGHDHALPLDAADIFGSSRPRTAASSHPDGSRFSSVDTGIGNNYQHQRQDSLDATDNVPVDVESQATLAGTTDFGTSQNHDDSGIGMGIDEEDMSMAKFGGFVADGVNVGSDPADVVVC